MSILITGANGFVGKNLIRALANKDNGVKGESRYIVVDAAKAGVPFEQEDPHDLNLAITKLQSFRYDAEFTKNFVKTHYCRSRIAEEMLTKILNILSVKYI